MNGYLSVISILRADGPVGLLIGGSGVNTARVFPGDPPQKATFPLICVETFDAEPFDTKSGVSVTDHELVRVRYMDDSEPYDLAEKGRDALDGYAAGTVNGRYIEWVRYLRSDSYEFNLTNRRLRVHEQEYQVRVRN